MPAKPINLLNYIHAPLNQIHGPLMGSAAPGEEPLL